MTRFYPPFATKRTWKRPNMRGNEEETTPEIPEVVEESSEELAPEVVEPPVVEAEPEIEEVDVDNAEDKPEIEDAPTDPVKIEKKEISKETGKILDELSGQTEDPSVGEEDPSEAVGDATDEDQPSEISTENNEISGEKESDNKSSVRNWKPWTKNDRKKDLLDAAQERGLSVTEDNTRSEIILALEAADQ